MSLLLEVIEPADGLQHPRETMKPRLRIRVSSIPTSDYEQLRGEALDALADALAEMGKTAHIIGGADVAAELDAKRAIDQGTRLAAML